MQRRVAAIYFVFFLVLGAGAYTTMAFAETPTVEVPGETYSANESFTVEGQQYTVSSLSLASSGGGGHGGGGGASYAGKLTYTNQSYRYTATLANNSTVNYQGSQYRVLIANDSDVNSFTLRQSHNVSNVLANDSAVYNETTTVDGEPHVTYRENNTNRPLSEYLPEPTTQEVNEGDEFQYQGNQTTVANVTTQEATLEWFAPRNESKELSEGSNVTLAGNTTYFAHFQGESGNVTVTLAQTDQAYDIYSNELAKQDAFHHRMNGLWGVLILSVLAAIIVISVALMPVKG